MTSQKKTNKKTPKKTKPKTFWPLTFVTLDLYHNRTLQELTRTGTSKDSTLLNHIIKPKTHSLFFKFTDLSIGQTPHGVPPVPQGVTLQGTVPQWGLQRLREQQVLGTVHRSSESSDSSGFRELRGRGALGESRWGSTLTAHSKGKPKIKPAFI